MSVPTDRRAVVRVQVRLSSGWAGAPSTRSIGGYTVMILGEAKPKDWPKYRAGDVEGMVWTTPRQVAMVRRNLEGQPGIIDTQGEGDSGP